MATAHRPRVTPRWNVALALLGWGSHPVSGAGVTTWRLEGALPQPHSAPCPGPSGSFNPNAEDPLPGQLKKQLVLRIISGQQLPKPRDSMLGDRGEVGEAGSRVGAGWGLSRHQPCLLYQIIDPFVEVEVIGLPVDCSKEQTHVVDDNGEGCRHLLPPGPRGPGMAPAWRCQSGSGSGPGLPPVAQNCPGVPSGRSPTATTWPLSPAGPA